MEPEVEQQRQPKKEANVERKECTDDDDEEEEEEENADAKVNAPTFYTDAKQYWKGIPATVDGVMGGFANLSSRDVSGSRKFLQPFMEGDSPLVHKCRALDCGAGIGRVSKRLLLPLFQEVDLVEQNSEFLERSREYLGESFSRVGKLIPLGLQEFIPEERHYDLVWCQWVLSHLRDDDLVAFLKRVVGALVDGRGLIVIKENIGKEAVFDDTDSSVTRSMASFKEIFQAAQLSIVKEELQPNWPQDMFPVCMFALRPSGVRQ